MKQATTIDLRKIITPSVVAKIGDENALKDRVSTNLGEFIKLCALIKTNKPNPYSMNFAAVVIDTFALETGQILRNKEDSFYTMKDVHAEAIVTAARILKAMLSTKPIMSSEKIAPLSHLRFMIHKLVEEHNLGQRFEEMLENQIQDLLPY